MNGPPMQKLITMNLLWNGGPYQNIRFDTSGFHDNRCHLFWNIRAAYTEPFGTPVSFGRRPRTSRRPNHPFWAE